MMHYGISAWALAVVLSALAGFIDAIGFLRSGGLFVSFMSGNSTRLGVDLVAAGPVAALAAVLIGSFVLGVIFGSLVGSRWPGRRKGAILLLVSLIVACSALIETNGGGALAMLVPLALAMGVVNNVFQRDGDVTIGVTYMTGALVRLGQRLGDALRGGDRWAWCPFLLLWSGLVVGAVVGALAYARLGAGALWVAAGVAGLLSLWGAWLQLTGRDQPREGK
ncbi:YoaK family protein [Rhizorhabdus sp. FW153]|uniref:YoaK family protein n=1 Tax=Rhizorhabdus sp. FW153 TaxID=3400216 RepID=UPI003CEB86D1